eukprot:scpid87948/ scgid31315/ Ribosome production factor 2 homolog; Brix domain-containing protein 1; Ribosome biogenesis protein RPF2 homolog
MPLRRVAKPKNQRVKRALEKREPKVIENPRLCLCIRGNKTTETVTDLLKDLHSLKKPNSQLLGRRHEFRPFEDVSKIEGMCKKYDSSLCAFVSHSKKRPNNLVLMRMFNHEVLDMFELGVTNFKSVKSLKGLQSMSGAKPCLIFSGQQFEEQADYQRLKSLLIDFFQNDRPPKVRLNGIEHVINFTITDGVVLVRTYRIHLKKSGTNVPRIELTEMGPHMDLTPRRNRLASHELFKKSCKQPKVVKPKKVKNVEVNPLGTMTGRIHMQKQDLEKLQLRKTKALKRRASTTDMAAEADDSSPAKKKRNA